MYPTFRVVQEYSIKITNDYGKQLTLYLDIFIKELNLAIECNGIQHFKPVGFFHNGVEGFNKSKKNDKIKKEWCESNGISLIEVDYDEDVSEKMLKNKIKKALKS